jgi:hypothetical protein
VARLIPSRGSWLDFEFDNNDLLYVRIDKKKKVLATTFLQAISNIMTGLPWSVGIGNIENPVLSSLSTVDRLAAEPRANEMIEVACGNDVTNELEQLRLPEPEAKNVN